MSEFCDSEQAEFCAKLDNVSIGRRARN